MASSALSIRSLAPSTATTAVTGDSDVNRDSQAVELWIREAQKCKGRIKNDIAEVEKYNPLSDFQDVSPLSTLDSKRKEKLATSKDIVQDIESLIHRCSGVEPLRGTDMTLPGCLLAYLLEIILVEKAEHDTQRILDHELDQFLQKLHEYMEMLNAFPMNMNLVKESVETLLDVARSCSDLIIFVRKHPDYKRAKANWAKSIAITTNAVLGSMNNRIIRTRIRHDASSTHDSAHPSASVQEMDAIHAAEPPSNPKTCYYIPTPKIPNFLGRDEQMKNLREQLDHIEASQERRIATLWGEGGIGKTQLALHYAEERKHSGVPFIFWISSENQAAVDRSFSTVAIELQLPGATGHGNHINNKYLVMQFLATLDENFLIIYDNIENDDDFEAILTDSSPSSPRGSLLFTSRHVLVSLETTGKSFRVPVLSKQEAKALLLQTSQRTQYAADNDAAESLAQKLDGLPLALVITGMNIKKNQDSVGKFLETYDKYPTKIHVQFKKHSGLKQYYPREGLHGAYQLSFQNINGTPAWELFRVLALLGPDAVPMSLFQPTSEDAIPDALAFCLDDWEIKEEGVDPLLEAMLARSNPEKSLLYVHRVIQVEFQSILTATEMRQGFSHAAQLLYEAFPKLVNGLSFRHVWKQCEALASHIVALCHIYRREKYKPNGDSDFDQMVKCLDSCAWYFREIGDFAQGEFLVNIGFDLCKNEKSIEYASLLNTAGILATRRNRIKEAYKYHEKCLEVRLELFDEMHEEVANSYNNIGNTYQCDCRWTNAIESYNKALKIDLSKPEDEHKQIVNIRHSNIAEACIQLGKYEDAIKNLEKSRQAAIDVFGEDTFYDADVDWIMGHLHYRKGELAEADACYTRTWRIYSQESASSMSTVAALYKVACVNLARGDVQTACERLKKALELAELNRHVKGDGGEVARVKRKFVDALKARNQERDKVEAKRLHGEAEKERKLLQKPHFEGRN